MAKYKYGKYHTSYFCGGSNIDLGLIMCEENIVILSILQKYALHLYHMYLLFPWMYGTEAVIFQHLYWTVIRDNVWKEVTNCDNSQLTKRPNIKYGKLPDK